MKTELYEKIISEGIFLPEKSSDGQFTGGYYSDVYMMPEGNIVHCNFDLSGLESIEIVIGKHPIVPSINTYKSIWSRQ